ncbi:MAG: ABC transporter ATP-binding protein, partial [Verrucomicrobia bacterium]|nr:ABC transporter ATP-binding protein [Verrucomicrobiota bacterium]
MTKTFGTGEAKTPALKGVDFDSGEIDVFGAPLHR